jgi:hypothetical protein
MRYRKRELKKERNKAKDIKTDKERKNITNEES